MSGGVGVFVVADGVTRLVPLTGKALPFLTQGGSPMVANWLLVAWSRSATPRAAPPSPLPPT
ncbi:hypothetical protein [Streptomyces misionensis]|uniref:hypothetical protein n=1 Tax=Streptomyces misionensis TaxID=67331 RepID=UPI0021BD9F15|nr:hypothetical protein [Streptomyces misionensis]